MRATALVLVLVGCVGSAVGSAVFYVPPAYTCPETIIHPCSCVGESDDGIDVVCDNTNLASMAVGLSQVKIKVRDLNITNCNIERLYGDVFRHLDVQNILIKDTPLAEIQDDSFLVMGEKVSSLRIINSRLRTFPGHAIRNLTNINHIVIDHSELVTIPDKAFVGLSKLKFLVIANSRIETLPKDSFSGQRGLKKLSLNNNNITDIVKGTYDFARTLEYLDLAHNRLSTMKVHYFDKLSKMRWLNLTDNGIPKMDNRAFSRNPQLAVLHLSQNNITKLDSNSFRGMRYIRRLFFEDNQIGNIGRNTFSSLRRIGGIYLRGNQIKKVDEKMFKDQIFIDNVDLSDNQISRVASKAFQDIQLATVNLSRNNLVDLPSKVFVLCTNITVDLSRNSIQFIHQEAFDENSYAFIFNVSHNQLTSLGQVPMQYQKGLKVLDLSYNQIVDIPKSTFPKLYELHTILLHHNHLSEIYRSVFSPLYSLRNLDLSYNHLEEIQSSTFGKLPTLLFLYLNNNKITSVRRGSLTGLVGVRSIWLHNNQLTDIPSPPISLNHLHLSHNNIAGIGRWSPWKVMNSIISLDLDYNQFGDNLDGRSFEHLNTLRMLKLRHNNISKPPIEAIGSLRSLQHLDLDGNNIKHLGKKAFGKIPTLGELHLKGNALNNISYQAFEGLIQIVNLTLSENNLTYIPPGAFHGLVALRNLDLSHNRLEKLENRTHGLLEDCLSLRKINLSFNNIPFVTNLMFPQNKWIPYALEEVDLSYNTMPVLTKGLLHGTQHLRVLNVSSNILNDVRPGVLGNMSKLEVLDLSYNQLQDGTLRADRWGGVLKNLTYLNLAFNDLYNIPAKYLTQFKSLKTLDVRGNDLIHYYPVFTKSITTGLDLRYEGNLLRCECSLRPVISWIRAGNRESSWDSAVCVSPAYLAGKPVSEVREEQLVCDTRAQAADFEISSDVKFRKVVQKPSALELSWFVNTNEDVADFRLELASHKHNRTRTVLIKDIGYNKRYDVLDQIPSGEQLRMCLLVKTSLGRIRRWRKDQQCQEVGPFYSGGAATEASIRVLNLALVFILFYLH